MSSPRVIAFYLPQFHVIPENDQWWGRGFTEWQNVAAAKPRFVGHVQPTLPADLGFYDLRLPETREAQAALAREHGVFGFCYYHYWFNGRRLLDRPFAEVLSSGQPDLPFCICWANENWTRAWDGQDADVLIAQRYSLEDDRAHIRALAAALADRRYIRVDGKPLLLVYRVSSLPDPQRTAEVWREEASRLGVGEVFLATVDSLSNDRVSPTETGFDATVEFQPDWLRLGHPSERIDGTSIFSYERMMRQAMARDLPHHRHFRCVTTGWDNTPRRPNGGSVLAGATPELYEEWLRAASETTSTDGEAPVVFVNAWNEWAEGAHLEPDRRWGRRYLEATRSVVHASKDRITGDSAPALLTERAPRVSICIPTRNGGNFLEEALRSTLAQTFDDFELVIVDDASDDASRTVAQSFSDSRIRHFTNSVRLGLGGNWNRCLDLARGEFITIFHQDDVMEHDNVARKVAMLEANPNVGFVHSNVLQIGPSGEILSRWWYVEPTADQGGVRSGDVFFEESFSGFNPVSCPSVVARRTLYEAVGRFDPSLPFTADWEMWMRAALFFDVGYLTEPLVRYRRHGANETLNFMGLKELQHSFRAKRLVLDKYPDRIRDRGRLTERLADRSRRSTIEFALDALRHGRVDDAIECLRFLTEVEALRSETHGPSISQSIEHALRVAIHGPSFEERAKAEALANALAEIDKFKESASWRITAPLRTLGRLLGRP